MTDNTLQLNEGGRETEESCAQFIKMQIKSELYNISMHFEHPVCEPHPPTMSPGGPVISTPSLVTVLPGGPGGPCGPGAPLAPGIPSPASPGSPLGPHSPGGPIGPGPPGVPGSPSVPRSPFRPANPGSPSGPCGVEHVQVYKS